MTTDIATAMASLLADLPDSKLLQVFDVARKNLGEIQRLIGHCEQEIYQRLEDRQAKAIPDNDFVCEIIPKNSYNQEALTPLREILVEADLVSVLAPAHEEVVLVNDKWNTLKVLALAQRLPEVQAVVEKARIEGRPKLKFEKR